MMFVMNLVISTDQLHYWELVMLCCVLVLFILIIVYETPITLYIKPLWIKILIILLNCVTV